MEEDCGTAKEEEMEGVAEEEGVTEEAGVEEEEEEAEATGVRTVMLSS